MGGQKNAGFVWTPTKRRGPIAAEFSTPGPAAIGLPSTFGANAAVKVRSPAFTISSRHDPKLTSASPGPGQYNINGLSYKGPGAYNEAIVDKYKTIKSPAFSMGQRTNIPSDQTQKPGPGAHSPEKCMPDDGPKWSMATKLQEHGKLNVPGPGSYEASDLNAVLDKQPVYSMRPKTELPTDKGPKPSPNAYSPEKCMPDDGPKWSMATKLQELGKLNVPGPGSYEASDLNAFLDKQPVYSMRPKTELPTDKGPKPSPNAYSPEKYAADDGPKWTMAPKTELPHDKSPKPSPNAYAPDESVMNRRNPEFSFGIKHSPYIGQLRDQ